MSAVGRTVNWVVVVGSDAIADVDGTIAGQSRSLRLRATDGGTPGLDRDRFTAELRDPAGAGVYESGSVVASRGDVVVTAR